MKIPQKKFLCFEIEEVSGFDVLWSTTRGRDFWDLQLLCY